jgi:autoinducer-2 kinase
MAETALLAIDVGTGSARAVLFDERGAQLAIGQREYTHGSVAGAPGAQVFDTQSNWRLICECVREALHRGNTSPQSVVAVAATSMREGMVCYDARGEEIWACPNVDARAGVEAAELIEEGAAEEIFARAGDWVAITAPARFRWIARHEPEIFAATSRMTMLGDWVLYRLSGAFVTDPSLGSSSGMFELSRRDWSPRILEICGLPLSLVPEVVAPGTVVGAVSASAAADTGLRAGTPVVVAGADTQLGLVGIGVVEPGSATVIGGSFWQHTVLLDEALIDPRGCLRTLCHTVDGQWMLEGIGFYSGLTMRWFRDAFCTSHHAEAQRDGVDVYDILDRDAALLPPGANGVVGIFSNLMNAKRWVHASPAFIGFDITRPASSGRTECFRAIEESAAYVSYGHLCMIEEILGRSVDGVVFTGGAAKGALWPRILADVVGVPVSIPEIKESTALGAAIYAGIGAGIYSGLDEVVGSMARFEQTVEPDAGAHSAYMALYQRWRDLYRGALALSDAGLAPPLWRAAGT